MISVLAGVFLATVGLSALWGFSVVNITKAKVVEQRMEQAREARLGAERLHARRDHGKTSKNTDGSGQPVKLMAKQRVMVVGGGLAGLAAAMKLAELGIDVDLMSLTPVKRSHSVCAKGASTASTI